MSSVTLSELQKCAKKLSLVLDADARKNPVNIVPDTFCAMQFINEPQYFPCDKNFNMQVVGGEVMNSNEVFEEADIGEPSADVTKYDLIQVPTTRNVSSKDERLIDYANNYTIGS